MRIGDKRVPRSCEGEGQWVKRDEVGGEVSGRRPVWFAGVHDSGYRGESRDT